MQSEYPGSAAGTAAPGIRRQDAVFVAAIFALVLMACILGYLVIAVPGTWFPRTAPKGWTAKDLNLVSGAGRIVDADLVVAMPDVNQVTLVSIITDLRASQYRGVAWMVEGLPQNADVRLLWRSDVRPERLNSVPMHVEGNRTLLTVVGNDPAWIGTIKGLALAIHGPFSQPIRIRGLIAKPLGVIEIVEDRFAAWFAFEPWNDASIDTINGGEDAASAPLPAALAVIVGASALLAFSLVRSRPAAFAGGMPGVLAGFFLVGWFILDARWTANLMRQEHATALQYAGKDRRDKHLASKDGRLFAFIEKVLTVMPSQSQRVFIAADVDYFRGRAAYYLYPQSPYFNPHSNDLPNASVVHAGDWFLVFQRHGIQFDRARGKLRWDGNQVVNAELKLVEPGAALFVVR